MKQLKKTLAILLCAGLMCGLTGCGNSGDAADNGTVNDGAIDDAGDAIRDGADDAGDAIRDGVDDAGDAVRKRKKDFTRNRNMNFYSVIYYFIFRNKTMFCPPGTVCRSISTFNPYFSA